MNNSEYLMRTWVFVLFGVLVDQVFKFFLFSLRVINYGPFGLAHYKNAGWAFGLPLSQWLVFPVTLVVLLFIVWLLVLRKSVWSGCEFYGWLLIFTGGISNLVERIILGSVRDPFRFFNSFWNLADVYIVLGLITLFVTSEKLKKFRDS